MLGLNLVVVTSRVSPPWGGYPTAVPVNARLQHAAAMIRELAEWLPDRQLHLCADGAYACLAGADLPRTHLTSRIRRDAALYRPPPARTGPPQRVPAHAADLAPGAADCHPQATSVTQQR